MYNNALVLSILKGMCIIVCVCVCFFFFLTELNNVNYKAPDISMCCLIIVNHFVLFEREKERLTKVSEVIRGCEKGLRT